MKMQIREEADRTFATLIEQLAKREIPKRQILSPTAWTYEGLSAPCTIVLGEHMQYRIDRTVRLSAPEKDTTSTHFLVKVTIEFGASKQIKALRKRTFVYQIAFVNTATPTHT